MTLSVIPSDDPRWNLYRGGYNLAVVDLSKFLEKLLSGRVEEADWDVLWDDLHHQGDVGEASFAVVPYLAEYARKTPVIAWHAFCFTAVVELARDDPRNPKVPQEVMPAYECAIHALPKIALERRDCWGADCFEPVMACLALSLGRRQHAQAYLDLTEAEIPEFYKKVLGVE